MVQKSAIMAKILHGTKIHIPLKSTTFIARHTDYKYVQKVMGDWEGGER